MLKTFRKMCAASIIAGSLIFMPITHAKVKTCEGVGEYIATDFESRDIAQMRAKERAEIEAKKAAVIQLQNYAKDNNLNLNETELSAIIDNIYEAADVKYERKAYQSGNLAGIIYKATLKLNFDTDGIAIWLNKSYEQRDRLMRYDKTLQTTLVDNYKQIEDLRKQLENTSNAHSKDKIKEKINKLNDEFLANQKYEEAA